jgi:hypothetical protein
MPTNGTRGSHTGDDLDFVVEVNKFEVIVIKAAMGDDLLEKCDELYGVIFVWLGQVDILQVNNQTTALFGLVDSPLSESPFHANLVQLLDNLGRRCLCVAVNCRNLYFLSFAQFVEPSTNQ